MNQGFNNIKVSLNQDEVQKLIKKYKNIKKYMRSPLYTVKTIDGTEKYVKELLEESVEDG